MKRLLEYKNGNFLSYAEYGDKNGFPILVQHGLIASIDDYDLFDRLLQANIRLICIARPGYGASSPYLMENFTEWAEIVSLLIMDLNLTKFDILGISSGAPYSYSLGVGFPDKVRNIFIFSGTPALCDAEVLSLWPYPVINKQSISDLEILAHQLFFSNLTSTDLKNKDIEDSMMNDCFGVAQDLRLRFLDWGFRLEDVKEKVFMRHSKTDDSVPFQTAVRTAELLPNCSLEWTETGPHFSNEALDDFIRRTMVKELNTGSSAS